MTGPVLLIQDGSRGDAGALAVARRLADLHGAQLQTLAAPGAEPASIILEAAAQARLIVMPAHNEDTPPADGVGAVTLEVLHAAPCAVVLVEPTLALEGWTLKRLLVPHDGSPAVSGALTPAADLARAARAELIVLQAAGAEAADEAGAIAPPLYMDQMHHEWPAWSAEFLHRLRMVCPLADLSVRLLIGQGAPADEALSAARAEHADLIALAWRGQWGPACAPTLKAILRAAPCPVLVTRRPAP
ncbi:MAG TPA: universal stress protein [Caulobacteraceae bacterium]|jgi:nucleotide-binding universal stress UspA family protein